MTVTIDTRTGVASIAGDTLVTLLCMVADAVTTATDADRAAYRTAELALLDALPWRTYLAAADLTPGVLLGSSPTREHAYEVAARAVAWYGTATVVHARETTADGPTWLENGTDAPTGAACTRCGEHPGTLDGCHYDTPDGEADAAVHRFPSMRVTLGFTPEPAHYEGT